MLDDACARHAASRWYFVHPAGLAASIDIVGVTLGGILGHSICTGAAVLGGRQLATHIQERTVHVSWLAWMATCFQLSVFSCAHGIIKRYVYCLHLVHLCCGGSVSRLQLHLMQRLVPLPVLTLLSACVQLVGGLLFIAFGIHACFEKID